MASLSTSVILNERCKKNASVNGSVCSHCYACKMLKRYGTLEKKLERNTELLTKEVLPVDSLPLINKRYFRFESFGDLNNETQVVNYSNICKKNPLVKFALWTKNPDYIEKAIINGNEKPENLIIIYSSLFLNSKMTGIMKKYPFIDKVFTVYDKETAKKDDIVINCGGNHCASCLRCYDSNDIVYINELLK